MLFFHRRSRCILWVEWIIQRLFWKCGSWDSQPFKMSNVLFGCSCVFIYFFVTILCASHIYFLPFHWRDGGGIRPILPFHFSWDENVFAHKHTYLLAVAVSDVVVVIIVKCRGCKQHVILLDTSATPIERIVDGEYVPALASQAAKNLFIKYS